MKRYERICSLMLAMLLLLGVFVACKSKPQKEQPFDTEPNTEIEWRPRAKYNGNNYYNIKTLPNDPNARCEKPDFTPSR
mgnify:CR=1 FL=1